MAQIRVLTSLDTTQRATPRNNGQPPDETVRHGLPEGAVEGDVHVGYGPAREPRIQFGPVHAAQVGGREVLKFHRTQGGLYVVADEARRPVEGLRSQAALERWISPISHRRALSSYS